jgi:hypothetical protein
MQANTLLREDLKIIPEVLEDKIVSYLNTEFEDDITTIVENEVHQQYLAWRTSIVQDVPMDSDDDDDDDDSYIDSEYDPDEAVEETLATFKRSHTFAFSIGPREFDANMYIDDNADEDIDEDDEVRVIPDRRAMVNPSWTHEVYRTFFPVGYMNYIDLTIPLQALQGCRFSADMCDEPLINEESMDRISFVFKELADAFTKKMKYIPEGTYHLPTYLRGPELVHMFFKRFGGIGEDVVIYSVHRFNLSLLEFINEAIVKYYHITTKYTSSLLQFDAQYGKNVVPPSVYNAVKNDIEGLVTVDTFSNGVLAFFADMKFQLDDELVNILMAFESKQSVGICKLEELKDDMWDSGTAYLMRNCTENKTKMFLLTKPKRVRTCEPNTGGVWSGVTQIVNYPEMAIPFFDRSFDLSIDENLNVAQFSVMSDTDFNLRKLCDLAVNNMLRVTNYQQKHFPNNPVPNSVVNQRNNGNGCCMAYQDITSDNIVKYMNLMKTGPTTFETSLGYEVVDIEETE